MAGGTDLTGTEAHDDLAYAATSAALWKQPRVTSQKRACGTSARATDWGTDITTKRSSQGTHRRPTADCRQ